MDTAVTKAVDDDGEAADKAASLQADAKANPEAKPAAAAPVTPPTPATGTAVATVGANGLQVIDYGDDADAGYENTTKDDIAVPFFLILHPQSPTVLEGKPGHTIGKIINSVTQELYDELWFVPATTTHVFNEWKPNQGGYVGTHDPESALVKAAKQTQEFGEYKTPEGNDLIETFYAHGMAVDPKTGVEMPATIPFKSTGIKGYRNWITNARTQLYVKGDGQKAVMPLMSHVYKLTVKKETKNNNIFFNFVISWAKGDPVSAKASTLLPSDSLFQAAVGVNRAVNSGKMKTDFAGAGASAPGEGKGSGGAAGSVNEKDIPF